MRAIVLFVWIGGLSFVRPTDIISLFSSTKFEVIWSDLSGG